MNNLYRILLVLATMAPLHGMQDQQASLEKAIADGGAEGVLAALEEGAICDASALHKAVLHCKPSLVCLLREKGASVDDTLPGPFGAKGYKILHVAAYNIPFPNEWREEIAMFLTTSVGQAPIEEPENAEEDGLHPRELLIRQLPQFKQDVLSEMKRNNRLFLCNLIKGCAAKKISARSKEAHDRVYAALLTFCAYRERLGISLPKEIQYQILSLNDDLAFDVICGAFNKDACVSETLHEASLSGPASILGKNRVLGLIDAQVREDTLKMCQQKNGGEKLPCEIDSYNFVAYIFDPELVAKELPCLIRDMLDQNYMDPKGYVLDLKDLYEFLLRLSTPDIEYYTKIKSVAKKQLAKLN